MEERTVDLNGKTFKVRELLAIELDGIDWDDKSGAIKKEVTLSTGLNDEEYSKLTVKERLAIINAINELNGFKDFQNPIKE